MAGSAGNQGALPQGVGDRENRFPFHRGEGLFRREGLDIFQCLGQCREATEDHGDAGNALKKAETPAGETFFL